MDDNIIGNMNMGKNINSIVGSLWQRQENESGSSQGNQVGLHHHMSSIYTDDLARDISNNLFAQLVYAIVELIEQGRVGLPSNPITFINVFFTIFAVFSPFGISTMLEQYPVPLHPTYLSTCPFVTGQCMLVLLVVVL